MRQAFIVRCPVAGLDDRAMPRCCAGVGESVSVSERKTATLAGATRTGDLALHVSPLTHPRATRRIQRPRTRRLERINLQVPDL